MRFIGLLFFATAFLWCGVSEAARVTPMTMELSPTGRNSSARLEITNSEDRQLPIEVRMFRGIIGERGELELEPADEKFLVFPPQVVVGPNEQQIFRIQYLPDEPLTQSQVYYASVMQIPVALEPDVSRIQVVMRFNVLVNVVPDGSEPEPVVSWARPATIEAPDSEQETPDQVQNDDEEASPEIAEVEEAAEPVPGIEVRIENQGNRFFAAGRTGWTISGTTETGEAFSDARTASQIGSDIGMGVVPPGGARIFFVPTDQVLQEETITVTLDE